MTQHNLEKTEWPHGFVAKASGPPDICNVELADGTRCGLLESNALHHWQQPVLAGGLGFSIGGRFPSPMVDSPGACPICGYMRRWHGERLENCMTIEPRCDHCRGAVLDLEALKKLESDLDHGDEVHTLVGFETYGDNITELVRALIRRLREGERK